MLALALLLLGSPVAVAVEPAASGRGAAPPSLVTAEAAFVTALATDLGRRPTPDDAVWQQALTAADALLAENRAGSPGPRGNSAPDLEGDELAALTLQARVLSAVGWHSRAVGVWDELLRAGVEPASAPWRPSPEAVGGPDEGRREAAVQALPTDRELFVGTLEQLAFAAYQRGNAAEAASMYERALEWNPGDVETVSWLARIALEEDDVEAATAYWQQVAALDPEDEGARYFLELSQERAEFGTEASVAFRAGLAAYEDVDLPSALERFEAAAAANPEFEAATVWAARTALESEEPELAARYWAAALALDPDDPTKAWYLGLAEAQARWGVQAANYRYDAMSALEAGDLAEAERLFAAAASQNRDYLEAWEWAARSAREAGQYGAAAGYWREVVRLDPTNERAQTYQGIDVASAEYGPAAVAAYLGGTEAYAASDARAAVEQLREAVGVAPGYLEAWTLLARVLLESGAYEEAAAAYEAAVELAPADEGLAFFAAEARRRADEVRSSEAPPAGESQDGENQDGENQHEDGQDGGHQDEGQHGEGQQDEGQQDESQQTEVLPIAPPG